MPTKITADLKRVRQFAQEKILAGSEPPWAWYQYMKLTEAIDAILDGMSVTTTENLQQSAQHRGSNLRLVVATDSQDTAQPCPTELKVRMPM